MLLEPLSDEDQGTAAHLNTSSEQKHRRSMEKQLRKFQKLTEKQNVQEYQENFQSKNYTKINSKVEKLRFKKWEANEGPKITIKDKVLINRRVLNDYIHIVNKRQDVVDSMEDNFWTMVQLYDGTLHYFNKYYGKNLEDQIDQLKKIIKPEHRYLLKTIDKNEARIKRRIKDFLQASNSSDPRLKKALEEFQNIEQIVQKNQEAVRQRIIDRRNQNKSEGHIEKLQKKKGYILNDNMTVEQIRQSQLVMNEVQKFGSDRIKRQLFVQDMKTIIENKEIQDKLHKIQQQMDKIHSNQPAAATTANTTATAAQSPASHHRRFNTEDRDQTSQSSHEEHHPQNNNNTSLILFKPRVAKPHRSKSPTHNSSSTSSHNTSLQTHDVLSIEPDMKVPSKSSFFRRRHSHNSHNPFLILSSQEALESLRQQSLLLASDNQSNNAQINDDSHLTKLQPDQQQLQQPFQSQYKQSFQRFSSQDDLLASSLVTVQTNNQMEDSTIDAATNDAATIISTPLKSRTLVPFKNSNLSLPKVFTTASDSKHHSKVKSVVSFALPTPSGLSDTQFTQMSNQATSTSYQNNQKSDSKLKSFLSNTVSHADLSAISTPSAVSTHRQQSKSSVLKLSNDKGCFNHSMRKASLEQLITNKSPKQGDSGQKIAFFSPKPSFHQQQLQQLIPLKSAIKQRSHLTSPIIVNGENKSSRQLLTDEVVTSQSLSMLSPVVKSQTKISGKLSQLVSKSSINIDANLKNQLVKQSTRSFQEMTNQLNQIDLTEQQQLLPTELQSQSLIQVMPTSSQMIKLKPLLKEQQSVAVDAEQSIGSQIVIPPPPTMIKRTKKSTPLSQSAKKDDEDPATGAATVVAEKKEKPLIRDKIYNENDIFKYKKINQYVIQEYYEKKILNLQKDEIPLLTASELQKIEEEKLIKNPHHAMKHVSSMNKDLFWNNVEEKKADFLSLEKERTTIIATEPEGKVCEAITRIHGSAIFDLYKDIQKDCTTQMEDSKTFNKDIREGEKELVSDHKKLKSEYNQNLGPKVYKSIYVEQILNQTKKQLNIKLHRKKPGHGGQRRSLSPEKVLQNLLKKDKKIQAWGKNLSKSARSPNENEKKYSIIATGLKTKDELKRKTKEESEKEIQKYIDKVNSSEHTKSLKEQLESLMNLDSQRKAMFQMTQNKFIVGQKGREKSKYINSILANGGAATAAAGSPAIQAMKEQIDDNVS